MIRTTSFTRMLAWPAALVLLAACDLKVTNPGRVNATFLIEKAALPAVVNGAGRNLAEAINWIAYTGAADAREIYPGGSTGSFGITPSQQRGKLTDDEVGTHWNLAQQARWTGEQGAIRVKSVLGDAEYSKSTLAAQGLVWAGFANRVLGENFCEGVIDGGANQSYTVYLERAEQNFTAAMAISAAAGQDALASAARAGRAQVRLDRGNYAGAATDAAGIPNSFAYKMPYYTNDADQYNRIYWASANQPYRAHTVWKTFYEDYYTLSQDPRTPWGKNPNQLTGDGRVDGKETTWYFQKKYTLRESSINLATGWEMRLIETEAKLSGGDIAGAMTLLNAHRVVLGLAPWAATTPTDAWTALKKERGIELWLEARTLGDYRRWAAATPVLGATTADMTGRDLCFATPIDEKNTNPNYKP